MMISLFTDEMPISGQILGFSSWKYREHIKTNVFLISQNPTKSKNVPYRASPWYQERSITRMCEKGDRLVHWVESEVSRNVCEIMPTKIVVTNMVAVNMQWFEWEEIHDCGDHD